MASVCDILKIISNEKSLVLLNLIALKVGDSSILVSRLNLTRKQYYSRISDLSNAGLIQRKSGKYSLTSFGKVIYYAQLLIGQAVEQLPKLKAIDYIGPAELPYSELNNVIDTLIVNQEIKEMLIGRRQDGSRIQNDTTGSNEQIIPITRPPLSD